MVPIAAFRDFFGRYNEFERERHDKRAAFLGRVRSGLPPLLEDVRQEERFFAPRFNIFRALNLERKEDDLHTPILAYLLNPLAQHGQGDLFLRHFFEVIRKRQRGLSEAHLLSGGHWTVQREYYLGSGGIADLLVENARKKYVVLIENKIDTDDHDDQIPRYHQWLADHRRDYEWRLLVYLTPDGRHPLSCKDCRYLTVSYRKEIVGFLAAALREVSARPVREVVRQYLVILRDWVEDKDDETG